MAPSSHFIRASRPLFRSNFTSSQVRNAFNRANGFRSTFQNGGRRFQSATASAESEGLFKKLWNSPVGIKTVHFW
jgi:hypothetical protein